MPAKIRSIDIAFSEVNEALLAACETGHRAEVWTKGDLEFINLYLDGFEMGKGKLAVLLKSENPQLVRMIKNRVVLFAEVIKESPTRFQIVFKELESAEVWQLVAEARQRSESAEFQAQSAQRFSRQLTMQKLLSPYRPSVTEFSCALRTPHPVRFDLGERLEFQQKPVEHFAETECKYLIFTSPTSGRAGYINAPADVKKRLLRAYFNGFKLRARIVNVLEDVKSHGLSSIWDECEAEALIEMTK